jgi:hypothetical protein
MKILDGVESSDPRAADLSRTVIDAVAAHDSGRALEAFHQLTRLDPMRAEALLSTPGMESVRAVLEPHLNQLTTAAKLHAESRLAEATGKVDTATFKEGVKPEAFVTLATGLFEAGGLTNYSRSAAISEALIAGAMVDPSRWIPAPANRSPGIPSKQSRRESSRRWLVLWFATGLVSILWCWWFRVDLLPLAASIWLGGGIVILLAKFLTTRK